MDNALALLITVVVLGLLFEFVNGFHDAANSIATVVATRVLSPLQATVMAGILVLFGVVMAAGAMASIRREVA